MVEVPRTSQEIPQRRKFFFNTTEQQCRFSPRPVLPRGVMPGPEPALSKDRPGVVRGCP